MDVPLAEHSDLLTHYNDVWARHLAGLKERDAALARAAEAEARAALLAAGLAPFAGWADYIDTFDRDGRPWLDDDRAACWGVNQPDPYEITVGHVRVARAALAAGPGPLLALARVAVRCDSESHDWDTSDLSYLIDAVNALPAWLREYLTREAGDAEPR